MLNPSPKHQIPGLPWSRKWNFNPYKFNKRENFPNGEGEGVFTFKRHGICSWIVAPWNSHIQFGPKNFWAEGVDPEIIKFLVVLYLGTRIIHAIHKSGKSHLRYQKRRTLFTPQTPIKIPRKGFVEGIFAIETLEGEKCRGVSEQKGTILQDYPFLWPRLRSPEHWNIFNGTINPKKRKREDNVNQMYGLSTN